MSRSKRNAAAEEYLKRAPNYSWEAILGLLSFADLMRKREPEVAVATEHIVEILESSEKFALPPGGALFDRTPTGACESWRPPFPATAFEYETKGISLDSGSDRVGTYQTITLVEETEGWTYLFNATRDPSRPAVEWEPCMWWIAFARDNRGSLSGGVMDAIGRPRLARANSGLKIGCIAAAHQDLLRRVGAVGGDPWEAALSRLIVPVVAVVQACAALACSNVTTEILRPNREARAARPASTLFDYHVLMVDPSKERNPSEDQGGTHASPRTHLRRGHIRRLAWGPRIWVNSCVVNPSAIGTVNKDYQVSPRRTA